MESERTVSLGCVIATVLWALTGLFIFAGTVAGITADTDVGFAISMSLMAHGLAFSAGAATVTMRNELRHQNKLLEDAFKLGQDVGGVRRMR